MGILKELADQNEITIYRLAKDSKIHTSSLYELDSGKRDISNFTIKSGMSLASRLDMTLNDLLNYFESKGVS